MSQLLLAGGGHTHALLLRRWAMQPRSRPAVESITLVSSRSTSLYSGLIPSALSGALRPDQCAIDLRNLCRAAGVSFVQAEIRDLDLQRRELLLKGERLAMRFTWLSLNLGASVDSPVMDGCLPIKPLEPVLAALELLPVAAPLRVVGSGAAAMEVSLALAARGFAVQLQVLERQRCFWARFATALQAAGVELTTELGGAVALEIRCTGSRGPAWLAQSGLRLDQRGRVLTDASLRSLVDQRVFATGDCGVLAQQQRPPSGVWAVRAEPVLAANLRRALRGRALRRWRPQRRALQLLGDGRGRAWALWGSWCIGPTPWLWRWKQRLDRRFMAMLRLPPMTQVEPMLCCGCAAKLPAPPLTAALTRLEGGRLPIAEDAAGFCAREDGDQWWQSLDGFPALIADPWLNGRLTAIHACSDLLACGVAVASAQVLVTLPRASAEQQEELLVHSLAGVRSVLQPQGAALIGGHTLQSREAVDPTRPLSNQLNLALVVNGHQPSLQPAWGKGPLQVGDVLILTRPLGTGVLFAAAMAGAAAPQWLDAALELMQSSQAPLLPLLRQFGCRACTDITGFGLLGHLNEMLEASPSGIQVQLQAKAVTALPGALELLGQGWQSSLAPANAAALASWPQLKGLQAQLLVDPQTCGPLLVALPEHQAEACLKALRGLGCSQAAVVGLVQRGGC